MIWDVTATLMMQGSIGRRLFITASWFLRSLASLEITTKLLTFFSKIGHRMSQHRVAFENANSFGKLNRVGHLFSCQCGTVTSWVDLLHARRKPRKGFCVDLQLCFQNRLSKSRAPSAFCRRLVQLRSAWE